MTSNESATPRTFESRNISSKLTTHRFLLTGTPQRCVVLTHIFCSIFYNFTDNLLQKSIQILLFPFYLVIVNFTRKMPVNIKAIH